MKSNESMGNDATLLATVGSRMLEVAVARGVEKGIQIGVQAAMDYIAEERSKAKKSRYDRRLHNTKLLLRNYRHFKKHAEGAIFNAKKVKENAIDILDGLDNTMLDDNAYVDGIKKSQQRTIIIMRHIDEMLKYYRVICEKSKKAEVMRRYRIITDMYIDGEKTTVEKLAANENIEVRTVYKDIKLAVMDLSSLIFGVDGLNIE